MMQEAGTDNSFEIIENKPTPPRPEETNATAIPMYNPNSIGNLLSSVPPPSALPNFISAAPIPAPTPISQPPEINAAPPQFYPTTFSAAIPPSKGTAIGMAPPTSDIPLLSADSYMDDQNQGGIFGWMKGAVATGGILSKVAEKAKSSVDSMITTLDPQMRDYLYSDGIEILVATEREDVISPIREAFQTVFGRAQVRGKSVLIENTAAQLVGFNSAITTANSRIASLQSENIIPTITVESFLLEATPEKWFDLDLLIINDPIKQLTFEVYTQMTAVPSTIITTAQSETTEQYPYKATGFAVPVATLLANNLQVPTYEWHQAVSGLSRRDLLLNAAKALAGLYKNSLSF